MINDTLRKYYLNFCREANCVRFCVKLRHTQQKVCEDVLQREVSRDTNYRHYTKIDNKTHCWR